MFLTQMHASPVQEVRAAKTVTQMKLAPKGPSAKEIAESQAKGLVWTNPTTKVYHKGGEFYGRTKNGLFMTEADAVRRYYRPSPEVMRAREA